MISSLLTQVRTRACAGAALLALAALPLQAQTLGPTYTVNVDGMPAGLAVKASVQAKFCSSGQILGTPVVVPLTESTTTITVPVEGLFGQITFRTITSTRYHAQLRPNLSSPTPLCALTQTPTGNNLVFSAGVAFVDAADEPIEKTLGSFGARTDVGPFTLTRLVELRIGGGSFGNTSIGPSIARGLLMNMSFRSSGQIPQSTRPELSFLKSVPSDKQSPLRVMARLFLSAEGRACISAPPSPLRSNTTVCIGDRPPGPSGYLEHGGVMLIGISPESDFQFGFTSSFAAGPYTMKSDRVLSDSDMPVVDGVPTNVLLGRIVPSSRPIDIQ